MIPAGAVADPSDLVARWWQELRHDPRVADLAALVASDRELGPMDVLGLFPAVLAALATPERQLEAIDAAAHAYLRAAGLHVTEE